MRRNGKPKKPVKISSRVWFFTAHEGNISKKELGENSVSKKIKLSEDQNNHKSIQKHLVNKPISLTTFSIENILSSESTQPESPIPGVSEVDLKNMSIEQLKSCLQTLELKTLELQQKKQNIIKPKIDSLHLNIQNFRNEILKIKVYVSILPNADSINKQINNAEMAIVVFESEINSLSRLNLNNFDQKIAYLIGQQKQLHQICVMMNKNIADLIFSEILSLQDKILIALKQLNKLNGTQEIPKFQLVKQAEKDQFKIDYIHYLYSQNKVYYKELEQKLTARIISEEQKKADQLDDELELMQRTFSC